MARIPDEVLARLKAEVSVARLVQGCGVELRAQGKDLVGCCPFHDDSNYKTSGGSRGTIRIQGLD